MSFWDTVKADLRAVEQSPFGQSIETIFDTTFHSIIPVVKASVAALVTVEAQDVLTGNTKNTGHDLAAQVKAAEAGVVAAGITASSSQILAALAVAKNQTP
jgi:hypothetical protein